ncbi:MAG: TPM domain-containing protein [Pseudomonadota bacterium]
MTRPAGLPFAAWLMAMLLALAAPFAVQAEVAVPELKQRVTDLTGTLDPDTVNRLETTLAQFEAAKGSQIAVLMVPTTQPEDIAQFGIRVAEAWKVGRRGVDDGAILIVAKDDRKVRIEVGYGLEGVIPDAVAKRIIEEDVVPRFKRGDFSGGVEAGVSRMLRLIEGEALPPPQEGPAFEGDGMGNFIFYLIAGIIGGKILGMVLGKGIGSSLAALGTGALAWLASGVFLFGLIAAFIVLVAALSSGRAGSWGSGGFGGGSWGGGGGGFSGGGGGFGGGGASGSW